LGCWAGLTGSRALTLRVANVYGPRQDPAGEAGVIAIFASRLLAGAPCVVNGDGEQTRDYVYVGDVADAVARAVAAVDVTGIANIGTGAETTVNELYRRLPPLTDGERPPKHRPAQPRQQPPRPPHAAPAKSLLGWTATTPLDDGLTQTVAWFRKELKR